MGNRGGNWTETSALLLIHRVHLGLVILISMLSSWVLPALSLHLSLAMKGRGRTSGFWWTALAAWLEMWGKESGGWMHAQWALAIYQLPECPHHISIGCWRGTEISHWAEPWYLSEEASQNQPEVKKQAHSAILSSSLVSPFRQMKKPRSRVSDSPKIPQLVYGRAEFGFSSVWEEVTHPSCANMADVLTSLGCIYEVGVRC